MLDGRGTTEGASVIMARPLRLQLEGGIYHVMNRGNNGQLIFMDGADKALFIALLVGEIERCGWKLHDYALMDNHFHLLVETPEANLSSGMHNLEGTYAQAFNRRHKRRGHLFGDRFKSPLVEGGGYLMEVARYIALNPVRAGMVEHPRDYAWSSYRAKAGHETPPPWLTMSGLYHFDRDIEQAQAGYREFVEVAIGDAEIEKDFMSRIVGQIVFGSEQFVQKIQAIIDSEERSTEHPRYQRDIGRPPLSAIEAAVCERLDVTPEELRAKRGDLSRMVFAMLGYWEGLRTLREIAGELGLRSYAHVSNLVRRCRRECEKDTVLNRIVEECRAAAQAHAPPLPEHYRSRNPLPVW